MADAVAAQLYEVPLEEFTAERNKLAASLKEAGESDAASAVKALKKPDVAAWTVNQLAHRYPDQIRELLALRDEMGGSSGSDLRAAGEKRRHLLAQLVKHADAILRDAGHAPAAGTLEKITQTLQAGATEEEVEALRAGRLTRALAPSGFAGLSWSDEARSEPSPPSKATVRAKEKAESLTATADEKEAEAIELEKAAAVARKHADAAARQAEVARRAADRARERAAAASAKLD
jgi:hypothetical protein